MSKYQNFLFHFVELRSTLIKSFFCFGFIFVSIAPFSNDIYNFFAEPLLSQLEYLNGSIIATKLTATFIVPFKITAFVALLTSLPLIFFQIWKFIAPGLFKKEKLLFLGVFFSGYCLFLLSAMFAYWVVFPSIFRFFVMMTPSGVNLMVDISSYLEMILALFLAFGIAFQIPVILVAMVKLKWVSIVQLKKNRSYLIIGAFVFGAIFTPPDVISQILLAIPVLILYELGIFIARKLS